MCGLSIHLPSSPAAEGRGLSASSGNSRQQCSASPLRQDSQGWSIPPLHTTASWRRWRISAKKLNLNQFNIKMNRYHNNVEFTTRSVTMIHLTYARHLYLSECVFITNLWLLEPLYYTLSKKSEDINRLCTSINIYALCLFRQVQFMESGQHHTIIYRNRTVPNTEIIRYEERRGGMSYSDYSMISIHKG